MIDIREHGGSFGGNGLKINGKKIELVANENIQKGDFIGLYNDPNKTFNTPTATVTQGAYDYTSENYSMDYSQFNQLISDAGHTVLMRGRQTTAGYWYMYLLKPYLNTSNKLSAVNYALTINGAFFSATKLNGNTFAIFHSNGGNDPTGLAVSIIRIDDTTGEPSLISKTALITSLYCKNCYFMPLTSDGLSGVVIYNKGNYGIGYSDNCTVYYGTLVISADFMSVSFPIKDTQIKYTAGESYGAVNNIHYTENNDGVLFTTHAGDYKLIWGNGTPVLTTIRASGATYTYDSLRAVLRFNESARAITIDNSGYMVSNVYDRSTNALTKTALGGGGKYKMMGALMAVVDREFLSGRSKLLNPQARNIFKPVGGNAFLTVGSNGNSNYPGNSITPFVYYMSSDLQSLLSFKEGSNIVSVNQYIDGNIWIDINDDLEGRAFYTSYVYYEGQGSFRYKYSLAFNLAVIIPPAKVSNKNAVTHGIAINNAVAGGTLKCIIGNTANTEFLLGV